MYRWTSAYLMLTLACFVLSGCGESKVATFPVKGKVRFANGAPVRTGIVEFGSDNQQVTASGKIQSDGTFVLGTYTADDGAAAGEHRVIVMQLIVNDGLIKHVHDHGGAVDPMYASYQTTPLTAVVEAKDANEIELIVDPPKKR